MDKSVSVLVLSIASLLAYWVIQVDKKGSSAARCYAFSYLYWVIQVDKKGPFVEGNENRQGEFAVRQGVESGGWFAPRLISGLEVNLAMLAGGDFKRVVRGKAKRLV